MDEFVCSLSEDEKKTLAIARTHLGDSFDMEKCIGFVKYKESEKSISPNTTSITANNDK